MLLKRYFFILLIFNFYVMTFCEPFIIIAIGMGLTAIVGWYGYNSEKCSDYSNYWIDTQPNYLDKNLSVLLHGQHLVKRIVPKLIRDHMMNVNPDKALVLSFHGWTGGGKNFVSEIVAKNIFTKYRDSGKSNFVRHFRCTHFSTYDKQSIREWIKNNVTNVAKGCHRSLFIFDEIDKLPEGVIDVIKPFVDYNTPFHEFKKSIFIFLSNTGGTAIHRKVYEFYELGKDRSDITWKDLEPLVSSGTFNEEGGLHKSDLVEKNLINAFVPFLPLEKRHIKQCINDYLNLHYNHLDPAIDRRRQFIRKVANELEYYPIDTQIYSKMGCKKIAEKVTYLIEEY